MVRKFAILSVTLVTLAGLSFAFAADDDESPTGKLMETVNKQNTVLRKVTRTAAEYKKSAASIPKSVDELVDAAKKARDIKEPAEKVKKPLAEYQKLMDDMIKASEDLSKLAAKPGSTQAQAKDAFAAVGKTCTACHEVFKKDE